MNFGQSDFDESSDEEYDPTNLAGIWVPSEEQSNIELSDLDYFYQQIKSNELNRKSTKNERNWLKKKKNLLVRGLIGSFKEPEIVSFLEFGGLITRSVDLNLKQRCGVRLTEAEQASFKASYAHSRGLLWFFLIYAARLLLLIFIKDPTIQDWLGDMTRFWFGVRNNYLVPAFLLSIYSAVCCLLFQHDECKLNWYLPFVSLKSFHRKMVPPVTDYAPFKKELSKENDRISFAAAFMAGLLGFVQLATGWFYYDQWILVFSFPW